MDEKSKDLASVNRDTPEVGVVNNSPAQVPTVSQPEPATPASAGPAKSKGLTTEAGDGSTNTALGRPITQPRPRPAAKRRANPWGWLLILLLAVAAGFGAFFYVRSTQTNPTFQGQTATLNTRTPVTKAISANGQVQANADLGITFGSGGTLNKLYKKLGDQVKVGDPLAQLDDTDLQNSLKSAQASYDQQLATYNKSVAGATQKDLDTAQAQLDSAKAGLTKTINGTYTAQDIASANASINSAAAKLQQDRQGGTPYDIASAQSSISSAQAGLTSAQAKLAKDQAGPDSATIIQAQTAVTTAQATYDQQVAGYDKSISSLKLAITNAQVVRDQALNTLKTAQEKYNTIYSNNRNPDGTIKDKVKQADIDSETGAFRAVQDAQGNYNKADIALNDARLQLDTQSRTLQSQIDSSKATLVNAQAQLDKTKQGLTPADIAADQASVASAQAQLDSAKKTQAALTPTDATIASDEAALSNAQASLAKLRGGTPEDIAQSRASVTTAQAALNDLLAGVKPNDIAIAKAQLAVSQAALDKAKTALANNVVKSPINGTIVQAALTEGQTVTAASVIYQVVDLSSLHVDVNVAESDIAQVKLDLPVAVNLDGVPSRSFSGKVTFISSKSTVTSNVVSYLTTVTLDSGSANSLFQTYQSEFNKLLQRQGGNGTGGAVGGPPAGVQAPRGASAQIAAATGICGYSLSSLSNQGNSTNQPTPKVGMTANVTFCLGLKAGVLAVPNRAIKTKRENGQQVSYVQVLVDAATNKIEDRPILTTGLVGDSYTEITGGNIKEGDRIVLSTAASTGGTGGAATGGGAGFPGGGGNGGGGNGGGR